ncbi:tetratricopeptide repeat protein [Loktanella sp. 3ANDIMAR09]|uniref:tetratricopeptide repeat protein n=1 Tax=Loktanella sp. 3ANDIMAR09 TaxID=1225657 RepID=UPI000A71AC9C|nr:tetratricopeptide repeat protein [Loktanella sp. 3ANDIMAR09]
MIRTLCLSLVLSAGPAVAQDACPAVPDHAAEMAQAITQMQRAQTAAEAQRSASALWSYWLDAPDSHAQALLDAGMTRRDLGDFAGAIGFFDDLVNYCPAYAEGYNQRALSYFLQRDFAASLADLDRALNLLPNHVAALSGKALTLFGLGRDAEGQATLRAAVEMNPWLQERRLLDEPPGTDI